MHALYTHTHIHSHIHSHAHMHTCTFILSYNHVYNLYIYTVVQLIDNIIVTYKPETPQLPHGVYDILHVHVHLHAHIYMSAVSLREYVHA